MKKTLLTLLAFMVAVAVNAGQVSKQQALLKAQQFMPGKQFGEARSYARGTNISEEEPFYVFNADNNGGFVIVSADDRTTEILGYSSAGHFDTDQMPDNLKWWLDGYVRQIEALGSSAKPVQKAKVRGADSWEAISPLIQTQWNQYYPYNKMCPDRNGYVLGDANFDTGHLMTDDQIYYHCVTGCVATAMAQMMYYYKLPVNCPDIPSYITERKSWTMKALEATTFAWDKMKKTYTGSETDESADAVAKLMRYCGQAVKMDYNLQSYGGSSAGLSPYDMAHYFGFGKNAREVMRCSYPEKDWESMIYKELSAESPRPVFYRGSSYSGGHMFIVDGYDGKGLFHMNWGWGGMSDGYYVLSLANSDEQGAGGGTSKDGYSVDQSAIIGLMPDNGEAEKPRIYAEFYGNLDQAEFSRGSDIEDFENILLPGGVFFLYGDPKAHSGVYTSTFDVGWGMYRNGSLLKVLGNSEVTTGNYYIEGNDVPFSFGSGLADGQYQFRQVYRLQDSDEWQLCETRQGPVFVDAVISGNKLTLEKSSESAYTSGVTINSVTFSPSELEVSKPVEVTVNLTNNGDSFQELLCLWVGSKRASLICGSVESGKTGDVKLHFTPTSSGETTLSISTDVPNTLLLSDANVVWSDTKTISAAKPQSLSATMLIDNFDDEKGILSGTTLNMTLNVKNEGVNSYENAILLQLYKVVPGAELHPLFTSKSVMATIEPGETKPVVLTISGLNLDDQYFFALTYSSAGGDQYFEVPWNLYKFSLTAEAPTPVPGDVTDDGDVDEDDLNAIVELIMAGEYDEKADLNNDEKVDAADLVLLIKIVNEQQEE
jgi:hypothetical protein